jgi:ABC-type Mn2+/Zn2+ transport system ATPase subunit
MEDDLLSLVPFKLVLIVISHDFKNINKGWHPLLHLNKEIMSFGHNFSNKKTKEKNLKVFKKSDIKQRTQ